MKPLLAHLWGDYVIQSDWIATSKTIRSVPALVHAASYTACFLPLTRSWKALAVIGGTHYFIDRYRLAKHVTWAKNQIAPAGARPGHTVTGYAETKPNWLTFWLLIIADNTIHLTINQIALEKL